MDWPLAKLGMELAGWVRCRRDRHDWRPDTLDSEAVTCKRCGRRRTGAQLIEEATRATSGK